MNPRIVVDTNVLLSGIFFEKGNEAQVLKLVLEDRVVLLGSLETLEELRETLARPKFHLSPAESLVIFQVILGKCEVILNINEAEVKCRDEDDQKFLDCAHTGRAEYLPTGDPDLLDMRQVGRTVILRAARLIRELKSSPDAERLKRGYRIKQVGERNVAEAVLLNERLRRKAPSGWDSARVIREWRGRRR